ncbi:hypothetical protein NLI96_g7532 [Meripilus lineatus]|uniref:Uncharacterized protein n=1 Tax=Meripilus lineatus TaxID=2056292 RepID=A0AAD5V3R6_9APHY|nr:hypothetical protein NLI96_g7532 [Physisporinus lineatus]
MDLLFDSAGLQLPDPSKEGDSLLSQSGPTSFHDANSHSETSWVPNRRESDSPSPPDADPTYAVDTLSPTSLGILRRLRSLLLPLVAIAYTTFCYIVHFKTIPVRSGGLFDDTSNNIAVIKSGMTSISIIIIGLGLLPIHSLIADLKSEEFFRVTSSRPEGTPLGYVNGISNPSFGMIDSFIVVFRQHCSPYYLLVLVVTILAIITSALAPAALSVETALFDSDVQAFAVGAIRPDDILDVTQVLSLDNPDFSRILDKASRLAWVEGVMEVPYSFQVVESSKYVVPAPLNLPMNVPARWLSDVAVMNPTCTYPVSLPPTYISDYVNYTQLALDGVGVTLNLDTVSLSQIAIVSASEVYNTTDAGYPANGATVFLLSGCIDGCRYDTQYNWDLSGLPVVQVADTDFHNNSTYNVSFLVCSPNVVIETREIRNDGHGRLTVMETPYTPRQGNLHPGQTSVMFSTALGMLDMGGGPSSILNSEAQTILLLGPTATNISGSFHDPPTLRPLPEADIAEIYAHMLHSATKVYLDGTFSTAYVPGRIWVERVVFASSLPQLIASTILLVILSGILILSHFRKTTPQFTLFSVAAALHGSEIPSTFAKAKRWADPKSREAEMVAPMGRKRIVLGKTEMENDVLCLQ